MYPPQCSICADYWVRVGRPMGDYLIVSRGGHIPGVHGGCIPAPLPCDNSAERRRQQEADDRRRREEEERRRREEAEDRRRPSVTMSGGGSAEHGAGQIGNINVGGGGRVNIG